MIELDPDDKKLTEKVEHCQAPSNAFLELLEECDGDPRSAIAVWTQKESGKRGGGWTPTADSRDAG